MADPAHVKRFNRTLESLLDIPDPLRRLAAIRAGRERLEALEVAAVVEARAAGVTWSEIGSEYGLSKQGAQQRFRSPGTG